MLNVGILFPEAVPYLYAAFQHFNIGGISHLISFVLTLHHHSTQQKIFIERG